VQAQHWMSEHCKNPHFACLLFENELLQQLSTRNMVRSQVHMQHTLNAMTQR
jgi:hypothetical protein